MVCTFCGSAILTVLGSLGRLVHLRCRACGMDAYMDHDTFDAYMDQELDS